MPINNVRHSEEKKSVIKAEWAKGTTNTMLADQFGMSRGAMCGLLARMGCLRGTHSEPPVRKPKGDRPVQENRPRTKSGRISHAKYPQEPALKFNGPTEPMPLSDPVLAPDHCGIPLLKLSATTCRWPLGNPGEAGFSFCGASCDVERPYCDFHSALAFRPRIERRDSIHIPFRKDR